MTRVPAQVGNKAGRTEHYLQWWEHSPEWNAVTPATGKRHNSSLFMRPKRDAEHGAPTTASFENLIGLVTQAHGAGDRKFEPYRFHLLYPPP